MAGLVKVNRIFLKGVVGGEVHATAKPPDVLLTLAHGLGHQDPHICVNSGHIGVTRMKDQGHTNRFKTPPREFGAIGRSRRGQPVASHMRKAHARALHEVALLQET